MKCVHIDHRSFLFSRSSAGNWLFRFRRWLDPADPEDAAALNANIDCLCALFPPVAAASCGRDGILRAVGDVAARWSRVCGRSRAPRVASDGSSESSPPPSPLRLDTACHAAAALPACVVQQLPGPLSAFTEPHPRRCHRGVDGLHELPRGPAQLSPVDPKPVDGAGGGEPDPPAAAAAAAAAAGCSEHGFWL
jgi:hypothetical protein